MGGGISEEQVVHTWTLQELVAPTSVDFFTLEWKWLGNRSSLEQQIYRRTAIALEAIQGKSLTNFDVDERMSWAAGRQTTREEDEAYSLLGIFDVQLPLLYGEGRNRAFSRLWDEIHKSSLRSIDPAKLPVAYGASFDSYSEQHFSRCLANTRVEVQCQIKEWADNPSVKSIFLLQGGAGTGKSTIARTIASKFANEHRLGASFFFKKGEGDRRNSARFFTTITMQIMGRFPKLIPWIRRAIETDPMISDKSLKEQLEKLILQPLSRLYKASPQPLEIFIVIDALDECEREEDIRAILQHLAQAKDAGSTLRIFITSRPELPIRLGFKKMTDGTYRSLVLHEIPEATVAHDLSIFLKHELARIREERSLPQDWPENEQLRDVVKLAIPLFIFAATMCRYIGDMKGNPQKRLHNILNFQAANNISKLDRTYLPILNQLFEDPDIDD